MPAATMAESVCWGSRTLDGSLRWRSSIHILPLRLLEQATPADMFLGDDFHHNGAFRLSYGFEYAALLESPRAQYELCVRSR